MSVSHAVEKVNLERFDALVNSGETVLADFYADWCPPCRQLAPVLEKFAGEQSNVKVVKVNIDEVQQLAARYQVSSIPTLLLFENGQPVAKHVGYATGPQLQQFVGQ